MAINPAELRKQQIAFAVIQKVQAISEIVTRAYREAEETLVQVQIREPEAFALLAPEDIAEMQTVIAKCRDFCESLMDTHPAFITEDLKLAKLRDKAQKGEL